MSDQWQLTTNLEQQNGDLAALTSVINTINQSSSLQNVLTTTLVSIKNLLGLNHGGIWLTDELTRQLTLAAHHALPERFRKEKQIVEFGQDLPGLMAESQQPLLIADLTHSSEMQAGLEQSNF